MIHNHFARIACIYTYNVYKIYKRAVVVFIEASEIVIVTLQSSSTYIYVVVVFVLVHVFMCCVR